MSIWTFLSDGSTFPERLSLTSDIPEYQNTDHLLNLVLGVTPRYEVAENFYVTADFSAVANVSQHYLFNGELSYSDAVNSFTGLMYNRDMPP